MKKKLMWLSDFDLIGSGYLNLSVPLLTRLSDEYDIKAIGLGYKGEEHTYPFSILEANNLLDALAIILYLNIDWGVDTLIVALDIPVHERILAHFSARKFKYIGITPIEAPPLCLSWATTLMSMDDVFIISEFGTKEAQRMKVSKAKHLRVGVDLSIWKRASMEDKKLARTNLGISDDTKVIITVADNQERKNLSYAMEVIADLIKSGENVKWILVTREHNPHGWILRDYALDLGISNSIIIFERGISLDKLWMLYAASDVFLLLSKAEGLGLPMLEAMAVGIPCVVTNCTGLAENGADGRAFLVDVEYEYTDSFGNGKRYFVSKEDAIEKVKRAFGDTSEMTEKARKYVETLDWNYSALQLKRALEVLRKDG